MVNEWLDILANVVLGKPEPDLDKELKEVPGNDGHDK